MGRLQEMEIRRRFAEGQTSGPAGIGIRFLPHEGLYKISRVVREASPMMQTPRGHAHFALTVHRLGQQSLAPVQQKVCCKLLASHTVTDCISRDQLDGGSAQKSGLVAVGDLIHSIMENDVRSLSVEDVINLIKGPEGAAPPRCAARRSPEIRRSPGPSRVPSHAMEPIPRS